MVEIYEILFMRSMAAESPSIKVANSASSASNANKSQNSEGGLFYIGRSGGRRLQHGVSGGHTRNGKANHKRKFAGPCFTYSGMQ